MFHHRNLVVHCAAVAAVFAAFNAQADISESGRAILEKNKPAVVTLSVTVNIKASFPGMGSQESEEKMEVTGTVVDPSGVVVTSLSNADPTFLFKRMGNAGGMGEGSFDSTITAAEYILADGSEVEAELVLRDSDLDLAFFRPAEAPASPMAYIDLTDSGQAQILDPVVVVNRLGRVTNRSYSASVEWIESTMDRPRTFYIPGKQDTRSGLGCPAFTADGKVLGLLLLRAIRTSGGGRFGGDDGMTSVILPSADIADLVDEAKAAEAIVEEAPVEGDPAPEGDAAEAPAESSGV